MKKYMKLLRVKHYIKNFLIFVPLFFSGNLTNLNKLLMVMIGTISFCFISSAVYIINDIIDMEKDRAHPVKKNRPIASGEISVKKAIIIAILCIVISILGLLLINIHFQINIYIAIFYLSLYLLLNIAYSFWLKNQPIIDIIILASGFLIRVLFGGLLAQTEISGWLYLTIISISFYLGLGKRRNELIKHSEKNTRNVLKHYTKNFLDKNMYVCIALAICFYALWAMNHEKTIMLWTVPIIMFLAMRYSLNIECNESEGDPVDVIIKDKSIITVGIIYFIYILIAIYII